MAFRRGLCEDKVVWLPISLQSLGYIRMGRCQPEILPRGGCLAVNMNLIERRAGQAEPASP